MSSLGGRKAFAASATLAAAMTHDLVFSAVNFNDPWPVPAYRAIFRQILVAAEWLWSHTHGWQPMTHIHDFGAFYAPLVELICPLAGFALFCVLSGRPVDRNCWKALGVVLLSLPVLPASDSPWTETARTVGILVLMIWSVGVRIRSSRATA